MNSRWGRCQSLKDKDHSNETTCCKVVHRHDHQRPMDTSATAATRPAHQHHRLLHQRIHRDYQRSTKEACQCRGESVDSQVAYQASLWEGGETGGDKVSPIPLGITCTEPEVSNS
eukprot:scaffold3126_cov201-Alexandrium_tamarense.AAC.4